MQNQAQKQLKFYINWLSQPSRAIVSLAKYANIPNEIIEVDLNNGEHMGPEYAKINPDKKVPAIQDFQDNNEPLLLSESHTILRYLCETRGVNDNLYPKNYGQRAIIDQYLDWHHTNTRKAMWVVFYTLFAPDMGIKPHFDMDVVRKELEEVLTFIDQKYLKQGKYIQNREEISIADFSCYCEVIQLKMLNWDFTKYKNLSQWIQKIEKLDAIQQSHAQFNGFLEHIARQQQEKQKEQCCAIF